MNKTIIKLSLVFLMLLVSFVKTPFEAQAENINSAQELEEYINFLETNKAFYTKDSWNDTILDKSITGKGLIAQGKDSLTNGEEDNYETILSRLKEEYGKLIPELKPNIALGKNVTAYWLDGTSSDITNTGSPLSKATDGNKDNVNNYAIFGNNSIDQPCYIQVDLGYSYPIKQVNLFRYWNDGRTYNDTALVISDDENFNSYQVLYYSASDKDTNIFNLNINPTNDLYVETSSGYQIFSANENAPKARYIRLYGSGSTSNKENHVVELEVYSVNDDPYKIADLKKLSEEATNYLNNTKKNHNNSAIAALSLEITNFNLLISELENNILKKMGDVSNAKTKLNMALRLYEQDFKMTLEFENDIADINKIEEGDISEIQDAINNGKTLVVQLLITNAESYGLFDSEINKIKNYANTNDINTIYNFLNIFLYVYDESDNYIGNITKLTEDVKISFEIPNEIMNAPAGMKREFYIIHVHGGEEAEFISDVSANGNILTFSTNKFSVFSLAYKDELLPPEPPVTPPSTSGSNSPIVDKENVTVNKHTTTKEDKPKEEIKEEVAYNNEINKAEEDNISTEDIENNISDNQTEGVVEEKSLNLIMLFILLLLLLIIVIVILIRRKKNQRY